MSLLSIGKVGMSRGQQMYYETQVAAGREDYYAGNGEAPGRWTGGGAGLLGLSGELNTEALKAMMDGRHPGTGEQLASRRGNCSTAAVDMTFSAPKSVSVLFAVGDEDLSRALVDAHEEAVDAAVSYMEQIACKVRRGHNGTAAERAAGDPRGRERARSEPAGGFVVAAYRHRMSRAQDPQLHTHCVAANMARGPDGRWTALDARHVYEHAKAGGAVYQAHLRQAVRERLAWASWGPVREGMAELEAVPAGVLREFSTRRRVIEEREVGLAAEGVDVRRAGRERIAFDTRDAKPHELDEHDWRSGIRARAAEHGLGATELAALAELPASPASEPVTETALAEGLFSPAGLTATANTFHERDVVIAVAAAHGQGARAEGVLAAAGRMLNDPRAVRIPDATDARFSTRELLDAEAGIVQLAVEGRGQDAAVIDAGVLDPALSGLAVPLTDEQDGVVRAIARSGNRVDTVEALAGTGKTTSAAALAAVYESAGYKVIGAAPTGRAVRELKERAGIEESRTLDAWALRLGADPDALRYAESTELGTRRVPAVMIIDEAGMAHTRLSAQVIDVALAADVKVVAIGDSGQLSSVRAGGWLGALTRKLGSHELRAVMRQRDALERIALAHVHRGDPDAYLELKTARGELVVFAGERPGVDAEHEAIERWVADRERCGEREAVIICRDNDRRERLNALARERLREQGALGESVEIAGREWAVGDRVIARRNDRSMDVDNGTRGTITAVHERDGLRVQVDTGGMRELDVEYVNAHLQNAYAITGHGMQGGTVEAATVVGQPGDFSRNWSYTALSRAREPVQVLVVDELARAQQEREEIAPTAEAGGDPLARMRRRMRERDDEDLALEQLEHARREPRHPASDPARARPEQGQRIAAARELHPAAAATGPARHLSPIRRELAEIDARFDAINAQLASDEVRDAKAATDIQDTIAAVQGAQQRDRKPAGWPDRSGHEIRVRQRERRLAELRAQREELLRHAPDPERILKHAEQLTTERQALMSRSLKLHQQAVGDELAARPGWLEQTLGHEPEDRHLRERWERTAREIAGYRIEHRIEDPERAFGEHPGQDPSYRATMRSITDTRVALGLDAESPDRGLDLGR